MNLKLLVLSILLLVASSVFAQDGVDYEMKKKSFTVGLSMQGDYLTKNVPSGFFLDLGYDFRKLYENQSFFMGIGPRVKGGWISGDNHKAVHSLEWMDISFNTLAYGASIAPSIGYEFLDDPHFGLYLEGEVGVINYSTTAKVSDRYVELFDSKKKYNSTANLYLAARFGIRANVASRTETAVWVGVNNQNTDEILDGLNLHERAFENKKIYLEIGFNIGF